MTRMQTFVLFLLIDQRRWIKRRMRVLYSYECIIFSIVIVSVISYSLFNFHFIFLNFSFPCFIISIKARFAGLNMINAKVPLLKFRDVPTNINFDLNVHNIIGIRNTRLLKAYVECEYKSN